MSLNTDAIFEWHIGNVSQKGDLDFSFNLVLWMGKSCDCTTGFKSCDASPWKVYISF